MNIKSLLGLFNIWFPHIFKGLPDGHHHQRQRQLLPLVEEDVPQPSRHDGPEPRRSPWSGGFRPSVQLCLPQRIPAHVRTLVTCQDKEMHTRNTLNDTAYIHSIRNETFLVRWCSQRAHFYSFLWACCHMTHLRICAPFIWLRMTQIP